MSKRWPRLTETLTGPIGHDRCRSCGDIADDLWQECDENDRPEARYLWLCRKCSDSIIEPHVRLYNDVNVNAPAPGAMRICTDCPHRSFAGICTCPSAKANGGPGILIQTHGAATGFIDGRDKNGRRWGKRMTWYSLPPSHCTGKTPTPFDPK